MRLTKFSLPAAVLTMLLAAVAAPYLIPGDPDSAVFRSGALALLLMLGCIAPVRHAYEAHSRRALVYGGAFGFMLALALGLGAELAFYDKLLPGMGSLVRRAAVPVMITPFFGALASYAFAFEPAPRTRRKRRRLPFIVYFLAIALCYALVMLAFYPGVVCYDFEHEIRQFTTGVYEAAHPVFHTMFLGALYALGESLFGSITQGAACYSAVQLVLLAALYAWACTFVQKRAPLRVALALCAGFALLPFHGVMAVSTAKDPLFAGLCVALCLFLWEIAEDGEAFLASRPRMIRFAVCCVLLALIRRNGVFAFLPACLAAAILLRAQIRRAAPVLALTLVCCFALPKGLDIAVGASSAPSSEMMAIPCQQLMRTAARAELSEAEYEEISAWFSGAVHRYHAHNADPAKGGNFDFARYQRDPSAFWGMYLRYAKAHPRVYVEAFLENCAGLWYPDDRSHATEVGGESYDFVYLITEPLFDTEAYPIAFDSKLPALKTALYDFTHHNAAQETPLLAQLFCPATYAFLLLLTTLRLLCKKQGRMALCLLPVWLVWGSMLFSAGVFVRYAYPVMAAAPVLLALGFFGKRAN